MTSTSGWAIELTGLTKRYGGRAVVDALDLSVRRGEILALLGPNGAGKTTTVEIVEGYRTSDGGTVRVLGLDPRRDRAALRGRTGIMLQRADLWNQVQVGEAIRLFASFYDDPLPAGQLMERVGLGSLATARYRSLSGGERQRLALALALVGRPELAILDEPTAAMDVTARRLTWEQLRAMRADGATILLTTHLLDEAEVLADRVAIIDHGHLLALGTPAELRGGADPGSSPERRWQLDLATPLGPEDRAALAALEGVSRLVDERPGRYVLHTVTPGPVLVELSRWLLSRGIEPLSISTGAASLEDVFVRLTEEAGP